MLEVAVGGGQFYSTLSKIAGLKRCVGADLSLQVLARTRKHLAAAGIGQSNLCRANALSLPYAGARFYILFNVYMMELLFEKDFPVVLREFARVLTPGGSSI